MPPELPAELNRAHLAAWNAVLDESSYYEILGILHIADSSAIREAFHEFALAFHPDAQLDLDAEERQIVQRIFQRGVEAYRVLGADEQRAAYDLLLAKGILRMEAPSDRQDTGARSLDELCVSAAAKMYANRAEAFITQGELGRAADELLRALRAEEGANAELADRLRALNTLVRLGTRPGRT